MDRFFGTPVFPWERDYPIENIKQMGRGAVNLLAAYAPFGGHNDSPIEYSDLTRPDVTPDSIRTAGRMAYNNMPMYPGGMTLPQGYGAAKNMLGRQLDRSMFNQPSNARNIGAKLYSMYKNQPKPGGYNVKPVSSVGKSPYREESQEGLALPWDLASAVAESSIWGDPQPTKPQPINPTPTKPPAPTAARQGSDNPLMRGIKTLADFIRSGAAKAGQFFNPPGGKVKGLNFHKRDNDDPRKTETKSIIDMLEGQRPGRPSAGTFNGKSVPQWDPMADMAAGKKWMPGTMRLKLNRLRDEEKNMTDEERLMRMFDKQFGFAQRKFPEPNMIGGPAKIASGVRSQNLNRNKLLDRLLAGIGNQQIKTRGDVRKTAIQENMRQMGNLGRERLKAGTALNRQKMIVGQRNRASLMQFAAKIQKDRNQFKQQYLMNMMRNKNFQKLPFEQQQMMAEQAAQKSFDPVTDRMLQRMGMSR